MEVKTPGRLPPDGLFDQCAAVAGNLSEARSALAGLESLSRKWYPITASRRCPFQQPHDGPAEFASRAGPITLPAPQKIPTHRHRFVKEALTRKGDF